jgi:addiction module HigA family antidote
MTAPKSRKPRAPASSRKTGGRLAAAPPDLRLGSRAPAHPGKFLETRFMTPMGISQQALAEELGISRRRVNELIRGHRSITPDTAIRLAVFFGTDAAFWMGLQMAWDMHHALRAYRQEKGALPPRAR